MDTELYALLCFYRDGLPLLKKAVEPLKAQGINIIAADGAFKGMNDGFPGSTDFEKTYVKENSWCYVNDRILEYMTESGIWDSQIQKRNFLLSIVPSGSYFIIIDGDEELAGTIDREKMSTGDFWSIAFGTPEAGRVSYLNRIYKKYPDMLYSRKHNAIYYGDLMSDADIYQGLVTRIRNMPVLPGCALIHHAAERDAERKALRERYGQVKKNIDKEPVLNFWNAEFANTRAAYEIYLKEKGKI